MKALRNLMIPLIAFVLTTGLALNFSGCTLQSPMQPGDNEAQSSIATLHKTGHQEDSYPQYASRRFKYETDDDHLYDYDDHVYDYDQIGYQGGNMVVPNGSTFHLKEGALTPPPETPHGESVTLTMLVEKITHGGKRRR